MLIEKAKEYIKMIIRKQEIPDSAKALGYVYAVEAIDTVLNELEKKDKVIDEMAKDILHDRNEWVEFDFEKYKDIEEVKEEYYEKVSDNK